MQDDKFQNLTIEDLYGAQSCSSDEQSPPPSIGVAFPDIPSTNEFIAQDEDDSISFQEEIIIDQPSYDPLGHTSTQLGSNDERGLHTTQTKTTENLNKIEDERTNLDQIVAENFELFEEETDGLLDLEHWEMAKPKIFLVIALFTMAIIILFIFASKFTYRDEVVTKQPHSSLILNEEGHTPSNSNAPVVSDLSINTFNELSNIIELSCSYAQGQQLLLVAKTAVLKSVKNIKSEVTDTTILTYIENISNEFSNTANKDTIFSYANALNTYLVENYTS